MLIKIQRSLPFIVVMVAAVFLWSVADAFDYRPRAGRPGPDLWPKIVLGLMFLAAAWGAIVALVTPVEDDDVSIFVRLASRSVGREEEARKELEAEAAAPAGGTIYAVGGMVALLTFVGLIPWLGFTVATFLLMWSVMMLSGLGRPAAAAFWSVLGTLAFFIVFQKIAYISLPLGEGPFRQFSLALMAGLGVR